MDDISLSAMKDGRIISLPLGRVENMIVREAVNESVAIIAPPPSYPPGTPSKSVVLGTFTQTIHSEVITNAEPTTTLGPHNSGFITMMNNGTYIGDPPLDTVITIGPNIQIGNNWEVAVATPAFGGGGLPTGQPTVTLVNQTGFNLTLTIQLQDANVNGAVPTTMEYDAIPNGSIITSFGLNGNGLLLVTSRLKIEYFAYGATDNKLILLGIVSNTYNPPSITPSPMPNIIPLEMEIANINDEINTIVLDIGGLSSDIELLNSEITTINSQLFLTKVVLTTPVTFPPTVATVNIPSGATMMRLTMCGGGGGGGSSNGTHDGGSGGGAGVIYQMMVQVSSNDTLAYVLGPGGAGGTGGSNGENGISSGMQLSTYTVIVAGAGGGGLAGNSTQGLGGGGGSGGFVYPSSIGVLESGPYDANGNTPGVGQQPFPPLSGGSSSIAVLIGAVSYPLVTGGGGAGFESYPPGVGGDAPGLGNSGIGVTPSGGSLYSIPSGFTYGGYGGIGGTTSSPDGTKGGDGVIILEFNV